MRTPPGDARLRGRAATYGTGAEGGAAPDKGQHMELTFAQHLTGLTVDGRPLRAAVFDENAVRAAAGLTMVTGAIAFSYAYFDKEYTPLQVVTCVFFVEF